MAIWTVREKGTTPTGALYLLVDIWFGVDAVGRPDLFRGGMAQVESWNQLHQTQLDPARWWFLLPEVRQALNTLEN